MDAQTAESESVEEGVMQASTQQSMEDAPPAADDIAAETTPPEPRQDEGWADEEEDEKWSILLDRTKCQRMQHHTHHTAPTYH